MSRVGETIKNLRNSKGMSQKQLGKKLGVSEKYINELEMGRKVANESLISRISKVLGKDINDINMYSDEKEEDIKAKERPVYVQKKEEKVNALWGNALSSILKNVPVYAYDMKKELGTRQLPVISNKINGYAQDKVFFLQVQDNDMIGFRIGKGDIAFSHVIHEVQNNAICFIEYNSERMIRQIKILDNSKMLLISNNGTVRTQTVYKKDIKPIAKLETVEISL